MPRRLLTGRNSGSLRQPARRPQLTRCPLGVTSTFIDILRPAAAGFFFILALLVLAAVFHRSWWAEELLRPHGIRPTAPDSRFRRRDFFRAAGLALALALVFLGLAFAAYSVAERYPNLSEQNHLAQTYGFTFSILAAVAVLWGVIAAVWGLIWRSSKATEKSGTTDSARDA